MPHTYKDKYILNHDTGSQRMALTKNDIKQKVRELGYTQEESAAVVEILIEIIKNRLANGEDVLVSGFGKFMVKDKAPRKGRNPATGEDLMLDSRKVVTFRCSGRLREKMNGQDGSRP